MLWVGLSLLFLLTMAGMARQFVGASNFPFDGT
jgi:hypothetical protein